MLIAQYICPVYIVSIFVHFRVSAVRKEEELKTTMEALKETRDM
jgi:hypothetical protein